VAGIFLARHDDRNTYTYEKNGGSVTRLFGMTLRINQKPQDKNRSTSSTCPDSSDVSSVYADEPLKT
jgi:hypothetical protein